MAAFIVGKPMKKYACAERAWSHVKGPGAFATRCWRSNVWRASSTAPFLLDLFAGGMVGGLTDPG